MLLGSLVIFLCLFFAEQRRGDLTKSNLKSGRFGHANRRWWLFLLWIQSQQKAQPSTQLLDTGLLPSMVLQFQNRSKDPLLKPFFVRDHSVPTRPGKTGLGRSHFARRYSGNRSLLSFPLVTKMFQFTRFVRVMI